MAVDEQREISATTPRSVLLPALLSAVGRTAAQHNLIIQAIAAHLGISPTDVECLLLLRDVGPASAGQLAEILGLTTGAITGVVDRLTSAGFVARESDPADRRRVIVQPIADQASTLDQLFAPVLMSFAQALEPLADASLSQLIEFERRASAVLEQASASLRAEQAQTGAVSSFSAPLGSLARACLEFAAGASNVRLLAAAEGTGDLYRATFDGVQPSVRVQGDTVSVRYRRMGLVEWGTARHAASVSLSASVPWEIALRGGAAGVSADLRGLELRGFSVEGGASKCELFLPAPRGSVVVRLAGGASRVQIQHPEGVPVQLQVRGGANRLEFDAQRFGAVGGELRLASPGWELATDRYVVNIEGGASRLTIHELEEVSPIRADYHE